MTLKLSLVGLFTCSALAAYGSNSGDEVIVVYNSRLPESKQVAMYYAEKRHVPEVQIFGFPLSTNEDMTRVEFHDDFEKPLANELEKKKLWHISWQKLPSTNNQPGRVEWNVVESKIRYVVLTYGVPLRVLSDSNHKEEGSDKIRPELRRDEAAVDTELALLPRIEEKLPLFGPLRNPVYAATNTALFHATNGVLMVTRLDGPTPAIARALVDKALEAEENGLWGRAYFDLRNISDANYKMGDSMLHNASEICRHLGFETVVDTNADTFPVDFPMSHIAFYAGWYAEHACGPFAAPTVEFMPGAFAYHLHSFSGNTLRSTNRFWVGPLLAKGATATMGTINEPYLSGTPHIAIFAGRFLVNGFTFGEAAYASQPVLSWQATIVGDPLYCPLRKNPDVLGRELQERKGTLLDWYHVRLVNIQKEKGRRLIDLISLLEQVPTRTNSAVLSEKLADMYAAIGKPSSALFEYQRALNLNPSPQQRARLRLTLADRLTKTQGSDTPNRKGQ